MRTVLLMLTAALAGASTVPGTAQERIPLGSRVGDPRVVDPGDDGAAGRRDPFVSVLPPAARSSTTPPQRRAAGLAGLPVSDAIVTGILIGTETMALLKGPDGKSFSVRVNDRLRDAVVSNIDADAVVFAVQAPDASGASRPREVRKPVRAGSGGKR